MTPEMRSSAVPDRTQGSDSPSFVIASTATAVPPHIISRDIVKEYFGRVFGISGRRLDAVLDIVDHSRIDKRHTIFPVDYLIEPRPLAKITSEYRDHAIALTRCAAKRALERAGIAASDVDLIVTVSCTGVMIPSV